MARKFTKKRRVVKRRRGIRRRRVVSLRNPVKRGGFPDTYWTPFTYSAQALGMGDNANVAYQRVVTLNDPTNNQGFFPLGWDTLRTVYDTYLVHAAKIKLTFQNTSATMPCRLVICPVDADSANIPQANGGISAGTFNSLAMSAYAKTFNLSVMGGGKDTVTLKSFMRVGKYAGIKRLSVKDDRYLGNTGGPESSRSFAQPVAIYRWIYAVVSATNATLPNNVVYVSSELTYYTQLFERIAAAF